MDTIVSATPDTDRALVGESLPKAMGQREMMRAFGISQRTFYRRAQAGAYDPFRLARPQGRLRWSGERVQAFLNGRER